MHISRKKLHELIDLIPDDRLAYIDTAFNQILRSELQFSKVDYNNLGSNQDSPTYLTLEDIFRDQDV